MQTAVELLNLYLDFLKFIMTTVAVVAVVGLIAMAVTEWRVSK